MSIHMQTFGQNLIECLAVNHEDRPCLSHAVFWPSNHTPFSIHAHVQLCNAESVTGLGT